MDNLDFDALASWLATRMSKSYSSSQIIEKIDEYFETDASHPNTYGPLGLLFAILIDLKVFIPIAGRNYKINDRLRNG